MKKPFAPDIGNPFPKPTPKPTGNGGGGIEKLSIPAFLPGQLNALATQLSGFGGSVGGWKDDLRDMTAPMDLAIGRPRNFGGGNGGHGGNGGKGGNNGGGPGKPGDPINPGPVRPDTVSPMHGQMPMANGFLPVGPSMAQAPAAGIFAAQQSLKQRPSAQVQLPPEIMAFMNKRR